MNQPNVDIATECSSWDSVPRLHELIYQAINATLATVVLELRPDAEISVLLCDDARIQSLNKRWRHTDKATNVLAFAAAEPVQLASARMIGDIVLAFETIAREAAQADRPLADHLCHLVVHGLLHLLGHDHVRPAQARAMAVLERRILSELNIGDPYRRVSKPELAAP
jgi:probable rRNA maturation factor